jgi:hypothetical protein
MKSFYTLINIFTLYKIKSAYLFSLLMSIYGKIVWLL